MRWSPSVMILFLAACGTDAPAADEASEEGAVAASPTTGMVTIANVFDPASVQPGDTVLGLRVESKNMEQVSEDSLWIGPGRLAESNADQVKKSVRFWRDCLLILQHRMKRDKCSVSKVLIRLLFECQLLRRNWRAHHENLKK